MVTTPDWETKQTPHPQTGEESTADTQCFLTTNLLLTLTKRRSGFFMRALFSGGGGGDDATEKTEP